MCQKQKIATTCTDFKRINRFGEKVHRTRFEGFITYCSIISCSTHHHGSVSKMLEFSKFQRELHPSHFRHPMVRNDQVRLALFQPSESLHPAAKERSRVAWVYTPDHLTERNSSRLLVVNDHYRRALKSKDMHRSLE